MRNVSVKLYNSFCRTDSPFCRDGGTSCNFQHRSSASIWVFLEPL